MQGNRIFKLGLIGALVLGVFAAGLLGHSGRALAQDATHSTYMVQAGAFGVANLELVAFAPSSLKVHRGDTVMWHINSFHNVHFEEQPGELIIAPEVDGKPLPQVNPAVAFPTVQSGAAYTGGDANSGLPMGPDASPVFSAVIDVPVGVYQYFCDVHPGMSGIIEVVADGETIPDPIEAANAGAQEIRDQLSSATAVVQNMTATASMTPVDGVLNITMGSGGTGRVFLGGFTPNVGVIKAGEKVTWVNPADSIDPHFVNALPFDAAALQDFVPQGEPGKPPVLVVGPGFQGTTQDGAAVASAESFNSGVVAPGQSFSLTFKDPGVYPYVCHIHPGMNGVIVVQ